MHHRNSFSFLLDFFIILPNVDKSGCKNMYMWGFYSKKVLQQHMEYASNKIDV
jgi:hypothetical protein